MLYVGIFFVLLTVLQNFGLFGLLKEVATVYYASRVAKEAAAVALAP